MTHRVLVFLLFAGFAVGQTVPTIANITNAAIPALDFPANSVALAPGSTAIIFGTNLADYVSSAPHLGSVFAPTWFEAAHTTRKVYEVTAESVYREVSRPEYDG